MSCKEKCVFTWKIENFSVLPHQNGNYLQSPSFSVQCLNETEFSLKLYPRGYSKEYEKSVSFLIERKNADTNSIAMGFSSQIKTVDDYSDSRFYKTERVEKFARITSNEFISLEYLWRNKRFYLPRDTLTIICEMWPPSEKEEIASESKDNSKLKSIHINNELAYITRIQVSKRCVTWPITKIQALLENKSRTFFTVDSSSEKSPSFRLAFSFEKDVKSEHAQIEITQTKSLLKKKRLFVKCKIAIMTACKKYQHSLEDSFSFAPGVEEVWNFPDFIKIANLADDKYIHLDDTLYLVFDFSFTFEGDWASHVEIPTYTQDSFKLLKKSDMSPLCKKIQDLYLDKRFCDVTLKAGGRTFSAQQLVLCAQSPVFCAMFENDMKEKNTSTVEIVDVDGDTMETMLEYFYSGILEEDMSVEEVCLLYSAAVKYQISMLKQQCTLFLLSSLSVKNVYTFISFADYKQDNFLMTGAIDFLKNETEIFHSSEWETSLKENPALFGKFMLRVLKEM